MKGAAVSLPSAEPIEKQSEQICGLVFVTSLPPVPHATSHSHYAGSHLCYHDGTQEASKVNELASHRRSKR